MDISALMGLQQGKGGGLKGDLTAEKAKGAAFAQGALQADISGAAAKLALEQKQREKLLAFEQRQRMIMLQLEQAQRLDGIYLEQKFRAEAAEKDYKFAKENMAADVMAEAASGFMTNAASGNASSLNIAGLKDAATQAPILEKIKGIDNSVSNLISTGQIKGTDMRLVEYLTKKDDILANATKQTPEQIEKAITAAYDKVFAQEVAANKIQLAKEEEAKKAQVRIQQLQKQISKDAENYSIWDEIFTTSANSQKNLEILARKAEMQKEITSLQGVIKAAETGQPKAAGNTVAANPTVVAKPEVVNKPVVDTLKSTSKPVVDTLKTTGDKQVVAATKVADMQTKELTESQYSIKLQKEMVALLGLSAQALNLIFENTKKENSVLTLNGRTLTQSLLNQARSNYGVNRNA
jgi:hypothetical protein